MEAKGVSAGPASERSRRRSEDAGGGAARERGRWSSRRKLEAVFRLLRGENLNTLSRELGVSASRLSGWRDQVLASSQAALKSRQPDERDEEVKRLRAKVGELTMENELLFEKIHRMEDGLCPPSRRSRR